MSGTNQTTQVFHHVLGPIGDIAVEAIDGKAAFVTWNTRGNSRDARSQTRASIRLKQVSELLEVRHIKRWMAGVPAIGRAARELLGIDRGQHFVQRLVVAGHRVELAKARPQPGPGGAITGVEKYSVGCRLDGTAGCW